MDNWSDLNVFLAVHRTGSLSGAGRALEVYPSTVGRRIAALEKAYGTVLFHRTPSGLVATAEAEGVVELVVVMERQAQAISQSLSGSSAALEGVVRVAMTPELADHFMTDNTHRFRKQYPLIELDIITGNNRADLPAGEADLAIRFGMLDQGPPVGNQEADLIIARQLVEMGFALYASKDYLSTHGVPQTVEDLQAHRFVLPSSGKSWLPGYDWIHRHAEGAQVSVRTDSLSSMVIYAAKGMGIALLPGFIAMEHPQLQKLEVGGVLGVRRAWILMPKSMRNVARIRATADFLELVMRESEDAFGARI